MRLIVPGVYDPADGELLVPVANVLHVPRVPATTAKDIDDLAYALGGRAAKPRQSIAVRHANGQTTVVASLGVTEAAELEDLAHAVRERGAKQLDREAMGYAPSVAAFKERWHEHMAEKARYFKAHAVTDPGTPHYERKVW